MKIKNLKFKIIITFAMLIYAAVLYLIPGISCPILSITGTQCPGCGMTRALFSALMLNFRQAFEYHFMFWSVPVLYVSFLFDGKLSKNKPVNIIIHTLIAVGFLINWLFCKIF